MGSERASEREIGEGGGGRLYSCEGVVPPLRRRLSQRRHNRPLPGEKETREEDVKEERGGGEAVAGSLSGATTDHCREKNKREKKM